jgi:hypothetical protein
VREASHVLGHPLKLQLDIAALKDHNAMIGGGDAMLLKIAVDRIIAGTLAFAHERRTVKVIN